MSQFSRKEIIEAIFTGNGNILLEKILINEISVEIDLLVLGFAHSGYTFIDKGLDLDQESPSKLNYQWIHAMAFSDSVNTVEVLEDLFLKKPYLKGDCLVSLWRQDKEKSYSWLKTIKEFDPQFDSLQITHSKYISSLCRKYSCKKPDLFNSFLLRDETAKSGQLNDEFSRIMKTEVDFGPNNKYVKQNYDKEIISIKNERNKLIANKTLSQENADKLFQKLWESNIKTSESPKSIFDKNPELIFHVEQVEDSYYKIYYKYGQEVNHLLDLIPQLSSKHNKKIEYLYNNLPFWIPYFKNVMHAMKKIDPNRVNEDIKQLLIKDMELGPFKVRKSHDFPWTDEVSQLENENPNRPKIDNFIYLFLEFLENLDQDFLVSMLNHYDDDIKELIQMKLDGTNINTRRQLMRSIRDSKRTEDLYKSFH